MASSLVRFLSSFSLPAHIEVYILCSNFHLMHLTPVYDLLDGRIVRGPRLELGQP